MELRKKKLSSGEEYIWTDYMSLCFTQNVNYSVIPVNAVLSFR